MTHSLHCDGLEGRALLTIDDLTSMFQVNPTTIRRWIRAGKLPQPIRISGTARWCPGCVEAAIDSSNVTS